MWKMSIFDKNDLILQFETQFWASAHVINSTIVGGSLASNSKFLTLLDNKPEILFHQVILDT